MGTGRVVLLHGFTQGPGSWDTVVAAGAGTEWPEESEVVRLTLPGHGGTGAVEYSFEEAAATLADQVGPPEAAWAGYSMGGRLALRIALDRPDLVERLVLLGATPGLATPAERAARRDRDETLAGGLERKGLDRFLAGWLAQPLFERLPAAAAGMDERRANTVAGLASVLRRLGTGAQEPLWDRLGELRMPVLLMAGEHDVSFSAVAFRMAAAIGRQARVSIVPGAGHAAHLERPDAFAILLERFLDREEKAHGSSSSSSGAP
ncbi:MAG: alpha/beta fold hydrolase [Acidimicrobiia bacterium]